MILFIATIVIFCVSIKIAPQSAVELQGDMGVHAEGEVVVDDVQGDVRLAAVHMVIGDVLVGRDLHPPAVHEHALRHPDLPQHLPDRFVRVALKENRL